MGDNIYEKTSDNEIILDRPFYKCPINSTHNTLIRHRSLLRESVMTELNCRVINIVLSTLKYPVFMEIDMKGHETNLGVPTDDCTATERICKIRHGFTGTSNLLDFLKTVCHAYSKCFVDSLTPYPLILGFDVTGSSTCDIGIFNEIDKLIKHCKEATEIGKSLICGRTKEDLKILSKSSLVTFFGDAESDNKSIETIKTPSEFFKFGEGVSGASAECSQETLSKLMGKIILRCKGKTLIENLHTSQICHIDYQSSSKIQVNTFNKVKYPELKYDPEGKKLLRVYPGFNANIRALSYQKTISDEIKKRLNELFTQVVPTAKGIKLDLKTGKFELPLDLATESEAGPGSEAVPKTVHGPSILKYINIVSYNYPLETEKDVSFQQLDDNFYSFYNKNEERKLKYNNLVESLVTKSDLGEINK